MIITRSAFRRACGVAAILAATVTGLATPAGGVAGGAVIGQGVAVSPAKIQTDLPSDNIALQVTLTNTDPIPHQLTLSLSGLGQDLDGAALFVRNAFVQEDLRLDATQLNLAPGQSAVVNVRGSLQAGNPGLYAALLATWSAPSSKQAQILIRAQVASLFLLRGPKPWDQRFRVESYTVRAGGHGQPTLVGAAVRDLGNVHVNPTGTARLSRNGVQLGRVALSPVDVLPGYARRLDGVWAVPAGLTKGPVTITSDLPPGLTQTVLYDPTAVTATTPTAPSASKVLTHGKVFEGFAQPVKSGIPVWLDIVAGALVGGVFILIWLRRRRLGEATEARRQEKEAVEEFRRKLRTGS